MSGFVFTEYPFGKPVRGRVYAPSRDAALAIRGAVFLHKKGGVYRIVETDIVDKCGGSQEGRRVCTYEHLWPHGYARYSRPEAEFSDRERYTPAWEIIAAEVNTGDPVKKP